MECTYNETGCGSCEALYKVNKYKWHDLRKNPDDKPKTEGRYLVFVSNPLTEKTYYSTATFFEVDDGDSVEWITDFDYSDHIVAWKEIEPFEEVEE